MKTFATIILSAALALFPVASHAGGIFTDSQVVSSASGDANVPANLYSDTLAGGAISAGKGMRVAISGTAIECSATFTLVLDDVELTTLSVAANQTASRGVTIYRTGLTQGGWRIDGVTSGQDGYSSGFRWGGSQVLKVVGLSACEGGAVLQNVFVER